MRKKLTKKEKEILDFSFYPYRYRLSEELKRKEILAFLRGEKRGADLGCGSGWLSVCLAKEGLKVIPIDISDASLKSAQFLFEKEKLKLKPLKGSILDLPFPKNSFDFVVLCEVLEHVPRPGKALKEINRCLKKGGKFCLSIPNSWTFGLIYDRFLLRLFTTSSKQGGGTNAIFGGGRNWAKALKKIGITSSMEGYGHINQFSPFSIKKLLGSSGFKIVKFRSLEFFSPYLLTFFSGLLRIDRRKLRIFEEIDQKLVKILPLFLASNWLILCQKYKDC